MPHTTSSRRSTWSASHPLGFATTTKGTANSVHEMPISRPDAPLDTRSKVQQISYTPVISPRDEPAKRAPAAARVSARRSRERAATPRPLRTPRRGSVMRNAAADATTESTAEPRNTIHIEPAPMTLPTSGPTARPAISAP